MADRYLTKGAFDLGANLLQGQVKEALLKPAQPAEIGSPPSNYSEVISVYTQTFIL